MTKFSVGVLSFCIFFLASCQSSRVDGGGVAGAPLNSRTPKVKELKATNARPFKFPRQRGQVKFKVPLDKKFEPSPTPTFQLVPKKDSTAELPKAIDYFNHDWNRDYRVKRLVR